MGCYTVMSSSNHPTIIPSDSDSENAFSSTNSPSYTSASPEYFPTSQGNNSLDFSNDFTKYLLDTLVFSPLYDDSYIQAYDATPPSQVIIALPAILPPSLALLQSSTFDSQDFLPSEEISSKDTETSASPSVESSSPIILDYSFW